MNELLPEETGYLTGTSSLGYKAFAEKYTSSEEQIINSLRFDFAIASAQNPNTLITAVVWDANGPNGGPGTSLQENTFALSDVIANVDGFSFTDVYFPNPPVVNGDYYVGFVLSSSVGDTLAIYCNQLDEINTNTAWCRDAAGTWYEYSDQASFGQALSLAVRPIQCIPVAVEKIQPMALKVYPNPADNLINIIGGSGSKSWMLFTVDGRLVNSGNVSNSNEFQISTASIQSGVYLLKLQEAGDVKVVRIVVSHP
jgi:hypothetical protein